MEPPSTEMTASAAMALPDSEPVILSSMPEPAQQPDGSAPPAPGSVEPVADAPDPSASAPIQVIPPGAQSQAPSQAPTPSANNGGAAVEAPPPALSQAPSYAPAPNTNNGGGGAMVWIPQSGSKYHSRSSCSNMKNPTQVTRDRAIQLGYTPCKKCY